MKGHKSHDFCPQRAHQVDPRVVNHVPDCAEFIVEPRTESCKCQKSVVGQVCGNPEGRIANRASGELSLTTIMDIYHTPDGVANII